MDLSHIQSEFRHIVGLSKEDRLSFIDQPRWIGYPQANSIINTMRGMMEKPIKPRMSSLLIVGDSNNGKTTVVQKFYELHGQGYVDDEADPQKPVIVTQAPPTADEKGLYIAILERFWTPYRATDSIAKLRFQVVHQMRHCHVKILIIDEFHSLLTGTPIKQREVMNAIKFLCNELLIPIVGAGTIEAVQVLHSDPQHASRFDVAKLPTWSLDKEFQQLLASFEKILPLQKPSKLFTPEIASTLHYISGGNIGDLHRLLIECAKEAIESSEEQITKKIINNKKWVRPTKGIREIQL